MGSPPGLCSCLYDALDFFRARPRGPCQILPGIEQIRGSGESQRGDKSQGAARVGGGYADSPTGLGDGLGLMGGEEARPVPRAPVLPSWWPSTGCDTLRGVLGPKGAFLKHTRPPQCHSVHPGHTVQLRVHMTRNEATGWGGCTSGSNALSRPPINKACPRPSCSLIITPPPRRIPNPPPAPSPPGCLRLSSCT